LDREIYYCQIKPRGGFEMSDIPNTESGRVAALAVAWEIVKVAYGTARGASKKGEEGTKELTNAVIKAFNAIVDNKPIE
jgi:hypothetical protein